MGTKTKTILRLLSILVALVIVLLQLDIISINIPFINDNRMWIMIISYSLLLVTLR
jgi:hypothetical protein